MDHNSIDVLDMAAVFSCDKFNRIYSWDGLSFCGTNLYKSNVILFEIAIFSTSMSVHAVADLLTSRVTMKYNPKA